MGTQVWEGEECASSLFRSRLWGTFTMLSTMIMKPDCWAKHMALDPETGLDPPGIRIRPAQGLEAADNFLGAWFWVRAGSGRIESIDRVGSRVGGRIGWSY